MVAPFQPVNVTRAQSRFVPHPALSWYYYSQQYYYYNQVGVRQKPPYVDTSLNVSIGEILSTYGTANPPVGSPGTSGAAVSATNKARAKFVGKLGESSQFGSTLTTELRSSWGTVSGGITNALLAANAVRRGRLSEAAKILNFHPPEKIALRSKNRRMSSTGKFRKTVIKTTVWEMPDGKQIAKSLGNKWLWYSYGVKPLVQDIYNGMQALTREPPSTKVVGFSGDSSTVDIGGFYQTVHVYKSSVRISAYVRVNNPNLWLANQLGLINPLQWFVEGVKLSFVVDWFSNLSQIVNQLTDFEGLLITRPLTTSKHVLVQTEWHPNYSFNMISRHTNFVRGTFIPQAKLVFAYERFNWQRGLNAISLLVGGLKNHR